MINASSTLCPPGYAASTVRHMSSSGPSTRSERAAPSSAREAMRKVMSGASNVLPKELAYLLRIISRTSSTRSSSRICTSVADAPGRRTHILRVMVIRGATLTFAPSAMLRAPGTCLSEALLEGCGLEGSLASICSGDSAFADTGRAAVCGGKIVGGVGCCKTRAGLILADTAATLLVLLLSSLSTLSKRWPTLLLTDDRSTTEGARVLSAVDKMMVLPRRSEFGAAGD